MPENQNNQEITDEPVQADENTEEIEKENTENTEISEEAKEDENNSENNDDINNMVSEQAEEIIEQPEIFEKSKVKIKKSSDSMVKIAVILGALTFATALLLSVLNAFTEPVIAERLASEKEEYVKNLFGGEIFTEELQGYEDLYLNYPAKVLEVLYVMNDAGEPAGFCVTVSPKGFSGNIDMLVAVSLDWTVIDTVILSMSETAGIGTKINENSFKEQFKNKSGNEVGSVDTIATATISSKAFLNGVNAALAVVSDILTAAAEEIGDSGGGE
jgi:electron transport complex protein RnfG